MKDNNNIVNSLWIGSELSALELLTLHSFVDHGHTFHLWVYDAIANSLPSKVILKDANEILPKSEIFRKDKNDPFLGIGKGSLAFFADLFRFKLLKEQGGWWVDMDMVCLKALDFKTTYFFNEHPQLKAVNNIIKSPKNSQLFGEISKLCMQQISNKTLDYLLPNKIFSRSILKHSLQEYILAGAGNRDWWDEVEPFLYTNNQFPKDWYFIHWMNQEWKSQDIDKNAFYLDSTIARFMQKHAVDYTRKRRDASFWFWHFKRTKLGQLLKRIKVRIS